VLRDSCRLPPAAWRLVQPSINDWVSTILGWSDRRSRRNVKFFPRSIAAPESSANHANKQFQLILGRLTQAEIIMNFGLQVAWLALMGFGFHLIWRAGIKRFSAVGA